MASDLISRKSLNAEKVHQRYEWLKAHGICVTCGNADAESGRVRCRRCLDVRNDLSRKWKAEHPERVKAYMEEYQPKWRAAHPDYRRSAGRLKPRATRIRKPDGTCRRKDCWLSALPFSCWCRTHLEEMRERRRTRDYLRLIESESMARSSRPDG